MEQEESFDDEVLLENSPLSCYLRETCPDQEFETIPTVRDKRHRAQSNSNKTVKSRLHLHVYIFKRFIRRTFELIVPPVASIIEDVNAHFLPRYSHLALESRLLLETDRQMIQAYCIKTSRGATHTTSVPEPHVVWLCAHMLGAMVVLCTGLTMFVPPLSAINSMPDVLHMLFCLLVLLLSAVYTIHWSQACWAIFSLKRLHRECIGHTSQGLQILTRQGALLRRSLRYIQEVEVISRGFTMVSSCTPIIRLENTASSKRRQCMALREACFSSASRQFNILRDTTLRLVKEHPLVAEIDHVSNYLAMVDLESSAPWVKITADESESQDSLSELTACFSLSALKAINSLLQEQKSEFIRRLILCVCLDARLEPQITVNTMQLWLNTLRGVCSSCGVLLDKLQRSYDCHRQRPSLNRSPSGVVLQGRGVVPPWHRVSNAVRSLRLHLEATLNRVITAEETLDDNDEHHEGNITESMNTTMAEMLDDVRRELRASQDCLQEAVASLERMSNRERPVYQQDGCSDAGQSNHKMDDREPIPLLHLRDAEIEFDDQIFEAYTDTDPGERNDEEWTEGISDAEKIRRRREADETKRMLQELRSVLSVRKAERERMKSEKNRAGGASESRKESNVAMQRNPVDTESIDVARAVGKSRTQDDTTEQLNIERKTRAENIDIALRNGDDGVMSSGPVPPTCTCMMGDSTGVDGSEPIVQSSHNSDSMAPASRSPAAGKDATSSILHPVTADAQRQFGLSLIPSLAAQAVSVSRQCQLQEETFCGTDEDSDDSLQK